MNQETGFGIRDQEGNRSGKIGSYRDLRVWRKSIDLVEVVYTATRTFPPEELYGLSAQARRSAVSIPSNIAEGHARSATGDYLRFLAFTLGSLAELETQLLISVRLNYLPERQGDELLERCAEIGKMLHGLRRSLAPES